MSIMQNLHTLLLFTLVFGNGFAASLPNAQSSSNSNVERQTITIKMVDAHSGKPVKRECLNISFGAWHGADTYLQTGSDGTVEINRDSKSIPAGTSFDQPCNKQPSAETVEASKLSQDISVLPAWYVMCQFPKDAGHDTKWLAQTPAERIGSYSVTDIMRHGIVTANHCSKLVVSPIPGQLIVVVRKRSFMEGMRS